MFALKLKPPEELRNIIAGSTFIIKCFGCSEVCFDEQEADDFLEGLPHGKTARLDYLCNREFSGRCIEKYADAIKDAASLVVFACGSGVQTVAELIEEREVFPGCDTLFINGFQGLKSLKADCLQCNECRLNLTAGICPLTACSKSLLNGPCGGAKDGKCEVSEGMDCGWEKIYDRLKAAGREKVLKKSQRPRDFNKMSAGFTPAGDDVK